MDPPQGPTSPGTEGSDDVGDDPAGGHHHPRLVDRHSGRRQEGHDHDDLVEIDGGDTIWRFDRTFLTSRWACIWGRGCLGILPDPSEQLGQGCCSFGAELDGMDEARNIAALAATLDPLLFERHGEAADQGLFVDDDCTATRVVDGACIFFNRPGFPGGSGCALHRAALAADEPPIDWKPSVCWQLPIKVDWASAPSEHDPGREAATVRGWTRADWGADGTAMAWCCTEGDRAYVGTRPVFETLAEELEAIVGSTVYVELTRRLAPAPPGPPGPA